MILIASLKQIKRLADIILSEASPLNPFYFGMHTAYAEISRRERAMN